MSEKKWFYNLGRLSLIFLFLAPVSAWLALEFASSGDGWAQAYGPLRAALFLFIGFGVMSFITGLLGIFHANKFRVCAAFSVFITSALALFVFAAVSR